MDPGAEAPFVLPARRVGFRGRLEESAHAEGAEVFAKGAEGWAAPVAWVRERSRRGRYSRGMGFAPHLSAELPGTLRVGPLRFPVYGLFATAGMLGALALSQRTAKRVGLPAERVWDAGVVGVVAAFVVSRVLLVAGNWTAFRAVPMLVLTLPSLTYGGALLAVVAVLGYLRWKRMPVLRTLDAWAPCAAVVAAALQLGHFFEGTDAGMPTSLPWGVVAPGDTMLGRTHPVQLYAVIAAAGLGVWWWRMLGRERSGVVAAWALMTGGAAAFALDMLRQPYDNQWAWPVEASQMMALGAMVFGMGLWGGLGFVHPTHAQEARMNGAPGHDVLEVR